MERFIIRGLVGAVKLQDNALTHWSVLATSSTTFACKQQKLTHIDYYYIKGVYIIFDTLCVAHKKT